MKALAHFNPAMGDQDSTVCVDVHQGPSLIQKLGGEGDAKLGGNDSQAPLAPPVGLVELVTCLLPLGKTCLVNRPIPAGLRGLHSKKSKSQHQNMSNSCDDAAGICGCCGASQRRFTLDTIHSVLFNTWQTLFRTPRHQASGIRLAKGNICSNSSCACTYM